MMHDNSTPTPTLTTPTTPLTHSASAAEPLRPPWSTPDLESPIEELGSAETSFFAGPMDMMSKPSDEQRAEYLATYKAQVDPDFAANFPEIYSVMEEYMDCFVVPEGGWTGINGFPDLELQFKPEMPERMHSKTRPIPPKYIELAEPEFRRLCTYFFADSKSPCASNITVAPKATKPFVRICGDYRRINEYIVVPQDVIPHVRHEIERLRSFKYWADVDCANAFHQHKLAPYTRQRLAVTTPWGLKEPLFLPEGVGPASGVLQKRMEEIFSDFKEWMLVIFDNMCVCANTQEELLERIKLVFQRCRERHLILKLTKSFIGVTTINFFGYEITQGRYTLSKKRRESICAIPMPTDLKGMQRFLGAALYFKTHIPMYSALTASLNDMTHSSFNWDPGTWTVDYKDAFEKLKEAIVETQTLHFPDYSLPWTLRTDASDVACGGTLLQHTTDPDTGQPVEQVIAFVSCKFSGPARRWDTIKKEAYGIYYSVHELDYYLCGKEFVVETDHNNLCWIEASESPIIVRWRLYLQGFNFKIRHIPGRLNVFADMLSRMYHVKDTDDATLHYLHALFSPAQDINHSTY